MELNEILKGHETLVSWPYKWTELNKGYTDKTLYINVSDNTVKEKPVGSLMKEKFVGGKGYGLRLLWDGTQPGTKWDDAENEIVIASGPVGGITQYSGTGKSICVSISPQTDSVMDSNVGGYFGPFLKFSGFDALELQGKASEDVIVFIDGVNHKVEIFKHLSSPLTVMNWPSCLPKCLQTMKRTKKTWLLCRPALLLISH